MSLSFQVVNRILECFDGNDLHFGVKGRRRFFCIIVIIHIGRIDFLMAFVAG